MYCVTYGYFAVFFFFYYHRLLLLLLFFYHLLPSNYRLLDRQTIEIRRTAKTVQCTRMNVAPEHAGIELH